MYRTFKLFLLCVYSFMHAPSAVQPPLCCIARTTCITIAEINFKKKTSHI